MVVAETIIVRECQFGQVRFMYGDLTKEEGDILVTPRTIDLLGGRVWMRSSIRLQAQN